VIVVDTSAFLDELFKFEQKRHEKARILFRLIEERDVLIEEPRIFKIELIGQLVRRMEKDEATIVYESVVEKLKFIKTEDLEEIAFSIAIETGSGKRMVSVPFAPYGGVCADSETMENALVGKRKGLTEKII
jgi:predicted nucleic acid-binding protein